jgi:hypothetical protein
LVAFVLSPCLPPAQAQTRPEIISAKPDSVAVTIYRDPQRGQGGGMNLDYLNGFAVVTEKRTVSVPAGPSTIRFASVAEGMVAVSAVVRGLPGGIVEQNRDKKLLSPGALVDGTLGNRVTLKRTDPATGKVIEQPAVIRSGSQGALVVQTEGGIEALQCSGLPEKVIYETLPGGLFATPVLSVDTVSPRAATVEVTLTYLASGFDWNADYVVKLGADGKSLDLFSWLTLANGNAESFADAELLVIAGTLNTRQPMRNLADRPQATPLYIQCWPRGSTAEGIDDIPPPPRRRLLHLPQPWPRCAHAPARCAARRTRSWSPHRAMSKPSSRNWVTSSFTASPSARPSRRKGRNRSSCCPRPMCQQGSSIADMPDETGSSPPHCRSSYAWTTRRPQGLACRCLQAGSRCSMVRAITAC